MKHFFKTLTILGLIGIIIFSGMVIYVDINKTVCDETLPYRLGSIDKKFNISQQEVYQAAEKSLSVWRQASGKKLFAYDPQANFAINLIFDDRQQNYNHSVDVKNNLQKLNSDVDTIQQKYKKLVAQKKKKSALYDRKKKNREKLITQAQTASTPELIDTINTETDALNKLADELNNLTTQINTMADKNNNLVAKINQTAHDFNSKYTGGKFEQGQYTGTAIDIYEFKNKADLTLVLAHEFGHALNLNHVKNPNSVMYYLSSTKHNQKLHLTKEDIAALTTECKLDQKRPLFNWLQKYIPDFKF